MGWSSTWIQAWATKGLVLTPVHQVGQV
jgi:hypothetical protein